MVSEKDVAGLPVANYDPDRKGIFIKRTRRIDILLGGIFDEYVLYFESGPSESIKLRPLEAVMKDNYM